MKVIKIKNCGSCPYKDWGAWNSLSFCEKVKKHIKDINIFPKWCPLEDLKKVI